MTDETLGSSEAPDVSTACWASWVLEDYLEAVHDRGEEVGTVARDELLNLLTRVARLNVEGLRSEVPDWHRLWKAAIEANQRLEAERRSEATAPVAVAARALIAALPHPWTALEACRELSSILGLTEHDLVRPRPADAPPVPAFECVSCKRELGACLDAGECSTSSRVELRRATPVEVNPTFRRFARNTLGDLDGTDYADDPEAYESDINALSAALRVAYERGREDQRGRNDALPDTRIERLTDMVSRLVQTYDGWHDENCRAFGAGQDEDLPEDPSAADPECTCGGVAVRNDARSLVVETDAPRRERASQDVESRGVPGSARIQPSEGATPSAPIPTEMPNACAECGEGPTVAHYCTICNDVIGKVMDAEDRRSSDSSGSAHVAYVVEHAGRYDVMTIGELLATCWSRSIADTVANAINDMQEPKR